jgi:hypothetical protein
MIKCYPAAEVEDKIRKQAADQNVPITQYLAPFLQAIAEGRLTMVPHFPPPAVGQQKAA